LINGLKNPVHEVNLLSDGFLFCRSDNQFANGAMKLDDCLKNTSNQPGISINFLDFIVTLPPRDMGEQRLAFENKIVSPDEFPDRLAGLPRPLVFTNGCFDVLHRGHVTLLAQARALGAALVVALNSDASVKRLGKGDDRPVNGLADRLALIAALAAVDLVTWFDEDTPLARIRECRPEVLVKGGDWPVEQIVGHRQVCDWGGQVYSLPFVHQTSTTRLLEKIRRL
jgi:rfaE bifunctional protein nucleotidyltransferase chain/domain